MIDLSSCNVLIVDDTEANIDILVDALGELYEVSVALDGQSALEIVTEDHPDLILLDIMMPGMDGFQVCKELKANPATENIPIIFLTAMTQIQDKTKAFELGAVDYITKPFEAQEVQARVKTHLNSILAHEKLESTIKEVREAKENAESLNIELESAFNNIKYLNSKLQTELKDAHDVQESLLPKSVPHIANYGITGYCKPAKEVGGDFYDFAEIGSENLIVVLGDVSGKGMPAALVMAECKSVIRTHSLYKPTLDLGIIMHRANLMRCEDSSGTFVTCFIGLLNSKSGQFNYCNAGHNPPILFRGDTKTTELLTNTGIVLGATVDLKLEQRITQINPGDVIVVYSDGITEAERSNFEQYEEERLIDVVQNNADLSAQEIQEKVLQSVSEFVEDCEQSDDITLMVIKRMA